ncbi:MAG: hypothetical protein LLG20_18255 [Acidobacteriales bacterium]|nr:hypothetical protein [Terriglobales bacterium]
MPNPHLLDFYGIQITESDHIGEQITPIPPARLLNRRGPYRQRTIKRWQRAHPSYFRARGEYFQMGSRILCHPEDARKLREMLRKMG